MATYITYTIAFSQLRLGANRLWVETGRWSQVIIQFLPYSKLDPEIKEQAEHTINHKQHIKKQLKIRHIGGQVYLHVSVTSLIIYNTLKLGITTKRYLYHALRFFASYHVLKGLGAPANCWISATD